MSGTVFVIGAGASTEYGSMPVGADLAAGIESQLNQEIDSRYEGPVSNALRRRGMSEIDQAAMRRVRDGIVTKDSIDDFIEEWKDVPRVAEVGKLAIAHVLFEGERRTIWGQINQGLNTANVVLRQTRQTWLSQILRLHNGRSARRSFGEVMADTSFIVFNYDRLIQYHLYHHLVVGLAVPNDEAASIINGLPIIHVYGSIGTLPELGGQHDFGLQDPRYIPKAASSIRTYSEAVESLTAERIAGLIGNAEKVVFLGAAYHQQNLDLLFPHASVLTDPDGPAIFGTTYGMRPRRITELQQALANPHQPRIFSPETAGAFVSNYQDDLFG